MELKILIKTIFKNKGALFGAGLLGLLLGFTAFAIPASYNASGSIYVGRVTDRNTGFFTYEGYYGQQTALAYTNSVLALIQSPDLLKDTLVDLNLPTDDFQMWKLKQSISVKKSGPQTQVINLSLKAKTQEEAVKKWNTVFDNVASYTNNISVQSDPSLKIYKVSEYPVVRQGFRSLPVFLVVGVGLSLVGYISIVLLKEYFKEGKK